jgi:acetylornithine deacetylase
VIDAVALLEDLVGIDSVNPAMGGPGEAGIAAHLAEILGALGAEVTVHEVNPGRPNVVAVLPGTAPPTILLEAHLDTVAPPGWGLAVGRDGDRIVGRGACDTKASCAAMVAALARLALDDVRPTIVFAGAMDEEYAMAGSRALLDQLPHVDAAVVGEPTGLRPVRVHNGLVRFRITARGASAHTSRAHLGVNAVSAAARTIVALEEDLLPLLYERAHPLAGPALLTAAVVRGGVAANMVPETCEILLDRRIAPGEDPDAALKEVDEVLHGLRRAGHELERENPDIVLPAVETPADHPLTRVAEAAASTALGVREAAGGAPYGTDASHISELGGIPCIVLGPGSIDEAHSDHESVPIREVELGVQIYRELVHRFASASASGGSS